MPVNIRTLKKRLESAVKRRRGLKNAYYRLRGSYHGACLEVAGVRGGASGGADGGVAPGNIVWIFCTPRSGSTWLRGMLEDLLPCKVWEEPKVAHLFGEFYAKAQSAQRGSTNLVLGDPNRKVWRRAIRAFVLNMAHASNPSMTREEYLVVKEPGGGTGAPRLSEALPESRMVLLVRDPKDFVSSVLEAQKKGNWMYEGMDDTRRGGKILAEDNKSAYVRVLSNRYVEQIGAAYRAYESHRGPKVFVRYETLRADTTNTLRGLCADLGIPIDEKRLAWAVEKHAWENIPEGEKGGAVSSQGQPRRMARGPHRVAGQGRRGDHRPPGAKDPRMMQPCLRQGL